MSCRKAVQHDSMIFIGTNRKPYPRLHAGTWFVCGPECRLRRAGRPDVSYYPTALT